ncbi:MAG: hypothetical protein ACYDEY_15375 [Acidimicrobiales bacterium]
MGDRVCATVSLAPFDEELLAGTREGQNLLDAITESGFDETSASNSNGVLVLQALDADANYWVTSFDNTGADWVIQDLELSDEC